MTHQRPLPDAAVPPYPPHPEPHDEMTTPAFFSKAVSHEGEDDTAHYTFAERFSLPEAIPVNVIAMGAALGLGVAAIAGALFFALRTSEPPAPKRPAARTAKPRATRKPRTTTAKT